MALTPSDVEQKTFSTALRGYDLDEVDDFLDTIVATLRDLEDQLAKAKAAPPPSPAPAAPTLDEGALGRVLVTAQATADSIVAEAKADSERILAEARLDADTWADERAAKKAEAEVEMAELSEKVASVRNQLAVLATAVADRLDEMDEAIRAVDGETSKSDLDSADDYSYQEAASNSDSAVSEELGDDHDDSKSADLDGDVADGSDDDDDSDGDRYGTTGSDGKLDSTGDGDTGAATSSENETGDADDADNWTADDADE
jgi:cell division initiation protein